VNLVRHFFSKGSANRAGQELAGVSAIVTDADTRLGLCVIRALGRAGCRVTALGSARAVGSSSRYAHQHYELPEGRYQDTLPAALEALGPTHDLVLPVSAFSISVILASAERLKKFVRFYLPSGDVFRLASDKREVTRAAKELGVPIPETYDGPQGLPLSEWAQRLESRLPLVVKFSDEERIGSWAPADRYRIVRSVADLEREYDRMNRIARDPLVQEYVEGDGYGFFAIVGPEGEIVSSFCHRRLREYPISGGPSTLCESVHDPRLIELGTRLLRGIGFRGVAMVEFKRDGKAGDYRLLEINPRFWGSLPLAIHCGVNFPVRQAELALGRQPSAATPYRVGRKVRFFLPDLLAVIAQFRRGGRPGVLVTYAKELLDLTIKDGMFELSDPMPTVAYILEKLRK